MSVHVKQDDGHIGWSNGNVEIAYDLGSGRASVKGGNGFVLSGIHAVVKLSEGKIYDSAEAGKGVGAMEDLQDGFGRGNLLTVSFACDFGRTLVQKFYCYENLPYLVTEVCLEAEERIGSGEILVLGAEGVSCPQGEDMRFLFAPFDNDDFVRYAALPLDEIRESYELGAVYDSVTRNGMVAGSISHDVWKTGINGKKGTETALESFHVTAGVTSKLTRDTLPHGTVYGKKIASPKVFLGFYEDYRDGLEAFGRANGIVAPPLKWDRGIPVGWNSWAAVADEINYDIYTGTSDFIREKLQSKGYSAKGRVYINFDSFWNSLTEEQLTAAVKHVQNNGQIPGIYTTPFTFWGGDHTEGEVPGTDGKYRWRDILLKDEEGNILPPIDGGYSIDPTHPGNQMRMKQELENFRKWGFRYVKMDFMAHGAVEGIHYDEQITTGIAAYNFGMRQINELLADELERQDFFISLSIAPIFPGQYAHGRRISCDAFGTIDWTEYMLNSLSYGWWLNENVYRFNDPDHVVLYNSYNHREATMFYEGLSRYFAAVVAGTMLLDSDDFREEKARERAEEILTNQEILDVARAGRTFRPVEGNTGERACDSFVRLDEDGSCCLAVFNFSAEEKKQMELSLARIGLEEGTDYLVKDLWSKEETKARNMLTISLEEAQPKLLRIVRA
ncbi:MAG: alpha-galactosidase [Lachnospiraceae bacterium]|nr:alpha-galactosidase [Lachnospiraceae bacterium]